MEVIKINTSQLEHQCSNTKHHSIKKIAETLNEAFNLTNFQGKVLDAMAFETFLLSKGYSLNEMRKILNLMLDDINKHDTNYLT